MNNDELTRMRLWSLGLSRNEATNPLQVVQQLCALQGQDANGALWAIGVRLPGSTEANIQAAFANGEIVRSWPLRGTLHVCAAKDLRWMLALTGQKILASTTQRQKNLELDEQQFGLSREIMRRVLANHTSLTRRALLASLESGGLSVAGGRGYHLLFHAAVEGVICIGPDLENEQAFVLVDDWIPAEKSTVLDKSEALAEITFRYFSSHGPASVKDLIGWTGLTAGEIRQGLESVRNRLESFKYDGIEYWMAPPATSRAESTHSVFLLPGFDEYMLGYKNRDAALDPTFADRICPGSNGMFIATIVCDGQVRGTWKKLFRKGLVRITLSPFQSFSTEQIELIEIEAQRYGKYLGLHAELSIEE